MKIAIIPARSGSKRIPRKNIKLFAGQPVLAYSVRAALASKCFDEIIVSTDDEEIAQIARKFGASTPFTRPSELAGDHVLLVDVINHAIQWFQEKGQFVSEVCCIFATAPFVSPRAISLGLETLQATGRNFALSITSFPYPVQRAIRLSTDGSVCAMYPEFRETRSQDLEQGWHDAGQFCWGKSQAFLERTPVFSEHTAGVLLPRYLVQDLDTMEDWHRAEIMYEVLRHRGELK